MKKNTHLVVALAALLGACVCFIIWLFYRQRENKEIIEEYERMLMDDEYEDLARLDDEAAVYTDIK